MKLENLNTKEHLWFLLEDTNHPIAILNKSGTTVQLNDVCREQFGIERTDRIRDLLEEPCAALWDKSLNDALEKGRATLDIYLPLANNRIVQTNVRLLYCDQAKKVIVLFTVSLNQQKKERAAYGRAFRKSDNLMFVVDRNGRIQDVNELTYEYFNLPRKYFLNTSIRKLFSLFCNSSLESKQYIKKVNEDGYAEVVKRYKQSTGVVKYYRITAFFDEETNMYLMRVKDETEKIQLEQQLDHQKSLAEVGQLAASIVHEIRNPMTTLKGFTQLLRNTSVEESKKYLTVIDEEIIRMEAILNEMLVLSKPSSNTKEFVSLRSLIDDIKRIVLPTTNLENIQIVESEDDFTDVFVFGDEAKLKQVLLNLFKNAYEAMESGGVLTTGLKRTENGHLQLAISDTGKGMNSTQIKQVFLPFFTTRREGTGLGLPFVLKTIEEHGASITVESEVGYGSTFIISFPREIIQVSEKVEKEAVLFEPS